ncbi:MAG: glycosyl transferase [Leptospiraceae bacterium]|nr:MAG: glycosyl transferase [Leptospiraceae bacterium]
MFISIPNIRKTYQWKKLKIAIVTETYPPDINGVANSLHQVINELKKQQEILILRPEETFYSLNIQTNLKEIFFPYISLPFYNEVKLGIPLFQRIYDAFNIFKPDIVHIITEGPLGFSSLIIAKQMKIPIIADYRTNFDQYLDFYGLEFLKDFIQYYLKYFHNQCDLTLVPDETIKKRLIQSKYQNIKVLYRGINTSIFNPDNFSINIRQKFNIDPDDILFLYVGRIAPEKNLDFLCNLFYQLHRDYPNIKLMIVGDGPKKQELMKKYPKILFPGQFKGIELAKIYASSDVFLFPSKTETFGNVLLEAYASGIPTISFKYAAANLLYKHEKNSFLIPLNSSQEEKIWYHNLKKYIENKNLIKKHKMQIIKEHKYRLPYFTWEGIAYKLNQYYYSILNKKLQLKKTS